MTDSPTRSLSGTFLDFMFSHDGRIGRLSYWLGLVVMVAITGFFAAIADAVVPARDIMRYATVAFIVGLLIWMHSAVTVKRLHDRDRAGLWYFLYGLGPPGLLLWAIYLHADNRTEAASPLYIFAMLAFIWVFVELGLLRGTEGPNRFGPDSVERFQTSEAMEGRDF